MRHTLGRLQQHQALAGDRPVEAPSHQVVDEGEIIELGIVAPQREFETRLAILGSVTGPLVTAHLAEGRLDLTDEADRAGLGVFHDNWQSALPATGRDQQPGLARLPGGDIPIGLQLNRRPFDLELRFRREIDQLTAGGLTGNQHPSGVADASQLQFFRKEFQSGDFRPGRGVGRPHRRDPEGATQRHSASQTSPQNEHGPEVLKPHPGPRPGEKVVICQRQPG